MARKRVAVGPAMIQLRSRTLTPVKGRSCGKVSSSSQEHIVVLPQQRCWPRRQGQGSRSEGIGHPGVGQATRDGVIHIDEKAARRQVFVFEQVFYRVDGET